VPHLHRAGTSLSFPLQDRLTQTAGATPTRDGGPCYGDCLAVPHLHSCVGAASATFRPSGTKAPLIANPRSLGLADLSPLRHVCLILRALLEGALCLLRVGIGRRCGIVAVSNSTRRAGDRGADYYSRFAATPPCFPQMRAPTSFSPSASHPTFQPLRPARWPTRLRCLPQPTAGFYSRRHTRSRPYDLSFPPGAIL